MPLAACVQLCFWMFYIFLKIMPGAPAIHCPFSFVLFREQNMSNGFFFFLPRVTMYLRFENKIEVFLCHSPWFGLKRNALMRRQGSGFSATENILDRLWGIYLPKVHGYLAHWKDLDAADFLWPSGKVWRKENGKTLCALVYVCWCQWGRWGFWFHYCVSSIFLNVT